MEATERFIDLVNDPSQPTALDVGALLIAKHHDPTVDIAFELARLDDLAASCGEPTLDGLLRHLFRDLGFAGDSDNYYDPANSMLPKVLDRRRGIPITLAVLTIEVGRRIGVPLDGVSMPGHFLLRDRVDRGLFVDPFAGGRRLDAGGAERAFRVLAGDEARFDPSFLEPVTPTAILARMLANLQNAFNAGGDVVALEWVLALRCSLPERTVGDLQSLATLFEGRGRFDLAADLVEGAADLLADGQIFHDRATKLRARLN